MKYLVPICALLTLSCTGIVDDKGTGVPDPGTGTPPTTQNPGVTPSGGGSGSGTVPGTPPPPTPGEPAREPFRVRNTTPELLPFDVRVRRIASAVGVPVTNPMFAQMEKNKTKLGDYDFANGVQPEPSWLANRIAGWIDALKPICGSPEMKAKYPSLPASLPALVRQAWGRPPTAEDTAIFTDALAASGATPEVAYESTCMAVFSAAEFVYR